MEGIGRYDAGLAASLNQAAEKFVEAYHPKRATNYRGRKTGMLNAIWAAKEALATKRLIHPRIREVCEALRVLLATRHGAVLASTAAIDQLKALIVSAPSCGSSSALPRSFAAPSSATAWPRTSSTG
ncbi:hypothetical protein ACWCXL_21145 [Streptomyces sp. NPDC001588]|uniref:hypothetical protein n=1 Tax=Streptomyces sp. NPDC093676 TaxID=3366050 RepID=UPI0037FE6898